MRRFASFVYCFLQNLYIDTFKHKTDKYSVHFQEMSAFKGKRKWGLILTLYKNPFRYRLPVSPPRKRTKTSSNTPNLKSPSTRTPSLLKKSLSISKYLYPFKRVSTPIRRNLFTKDDGNFTADLQNVSFMSLDESIGKIEVDPKEEALVVEVFQDVLDKLSDVGKKDKLLKFFKLVQDGKFPLNNIAFELFVDIVGWFDKDESRQMRYSPSTLQLCWLGRKLFGGRFIRFMSGPKHESDILTGSSTPNMCGNPFERIYIFWNWKRFF